MSGLIQSSVSVAANTTIDDVLVNNILAMNRSMKQAVDYGIVASAAGLLVQVSVGVNLVAPEFSPSLQNRFPLFPDDLLGTFGVLPADRIITRVRNTTGGALNLFWCFRFRP